MSKASDNVFPRFLISEGGSTSTPAAGRVTVYAKADGLLYQKDDAGVETLLASGASGSVATDAIWDAAGDLAVGSGANTAARLAIGATNGMALRRVSGSVAWDLPPGYEFSYIEFTSAVSITATTEGTANTVVTSDAVTYDGSTAILIDFFSYTAGPPSGGNNTLQLWLYDGASSIGTLGQINITNAAAANLKSLRLARRLTPSAASHTYSVRGSVNTGTGTVYAGAGGTGNAVPGYIRITKA